MTSAPTTAPAVPALGEGEAERLDAAVADLQTGTSVWTALTVAQRATLLRQVRTSVAATADDWATTAAASKGLDARHPLRGEEWLSGPYSVLGALDASIATLTRIANGANPLDGIRVDRAPGGRARVHAFPLTGIDRFLLSGFTGEVWLEPGTTPNAARAGAGLAQRTPTVSGGVGLVLGAGNVTSIPVLDVLYELLAHNRTALLKVNPTQDALVPVYKRALAPLIEPGLLRIVRGGPAAGAYLTQHPGLAHVHITGSAATFDTIVWGPSSGEGAAATKRRRRENRPLLKKPITAELGGVSPIIVVPGKWTAADLAYQAEHIATMRLQNSGHNCIAGQVVILSADWDQADDFRAALRHAYATAPERPIWYPGAPSRMQAATDDYPDALVLGDRLLVEIDGDEDPAALESTEYFAPVLGVVSLPGTGQEFLDAAVAHANEKLQGTLGANLLIDPATEKALGSGFERALTALHYGSIAINGWTAFGFITPTLTWGAFPGGTIDDVGSGIGVVHNALLLDRVERSVLRGPFRPFPRSLPVANGGGRLTILPKPPWFVSSRTGAAVSEGLTRHRADGGAVGLVKTLMRALRA
ncbi:MULTISPECIES: aldehyde dehydrogenase family protein [Microbacterium]|uniref:aldehyde dehydrogenase family protein n=1 Tax=Microbacterium TaxID=33882 RepID=UPI002285D1C5|nr:MULTISPECIES: aldehyde dehydrogenase family protein [Microbacterium]MCZ0711224.1 aldehyde dehydrogenase family protein [Microbacterium paraoxydans]MDH5131920.1 aldehyde dehydrogenase family protein [Microbacterium sp. RD10]MDH5135817.1 aldehyde dehydrogenase family protein [Microbacterium sp. RD11]MDH5146751.1 aldehyde dehydrogenase family protein [Microbacterium sp. RD12]MDH5154104.1 aldehyde dehydrogenase family protein [Microbacterium sp. RD06]